MNGKRLPNDWSYLLHVRAFVGKAGGEHLVRAPRAPGLADHVHDASCLMGEAIQDIFFQVLPYEGKERVRHSERPDDKEEKIDAVVNLPAEEHRERVSKGQDVL